MLEHPSTPSQFLRLLPAWLRQRGGSRPENTYRQTAWQHAEQACLAACHQERVQWQSLVCDDRSLSDLLDGQGAGRLWVVSRRLPAAARRALVERSGPDCQAAVLVCPESIGPVRRALILNDARQPDGAFLCSAADLCRRLGVSPVVLTVARSERSAQRATARAQAALEHSDVSVLFDCLMGLGVRAAVGRIAHWRRCQLVMMNQGQTPSWWQRLRGPAVPLLADWMPELSFLSLPSGITDERTSVPGAREPSRGSLLRQ